jgi:nitrate/nitrite transporter NarK
MGALSDRSGNRRLYTAISNGGFAFLFILATLFSGQIWLSFGLLVATGLFTKSIQSTFWAMPAVLFPQGTSGAARGFINGLGNLGGFTGPTLAGWLATMSGGDMKYGVYGLVCSLILATIVTLMLPKSTTHFMKIEGDVKK